MFFLRKYYVFNLDVIFNGSVYTFFPYGGENCGSYSTYEKISDCNKIGNIYKEKIPKNLKGCPVKMMPYIIAPFVTSLDAPKNNPALSGVEMVISNNIAKIMNYTGLLTLKNCTYLEDRNEHSIAEQIFTLNIN